MGMVFQRQGCSKSPPPDLVRYASNILTTNYYYVWYHLLHISPHYPLPSCFRFTAFSAQWMDPCFACKCAFEFGESSS